MLKVRGLIVEKPLLTLSNITFEVNKGEIVALIGPNASGKSAILERIADPYAEYKGSIVVNHFNAQTEPDRYQHQLGYLPEHFTPPLHLTGYEFLEIIGSLYQMDGNERSKRIVHLANTLDCQKEIYTVMERVSLAVRQKVGLIAALLAEPAVLILDEPLTYLDEDARIIIIKLLKEQAKKDTSIIISTNDLALAEEVAEYFVIIREGEVIADGTLAELSHTAQTAKALPEIYRELVNRK
jgi:ABC-2 type transport system ATP-binding protein